MNEFILNFLVNSAWQIPAICALAALGSYLLKNCSAQYRYTVWIAALFFCLVAPVITATQPAPALPVISYSSLPAAATNGEDAPVDLTRRRNSQIVMSASQRNISVVAVAFALFLGLCTIRLMRLWLKIGRASCR